MNLKQGAVKEKKAKISAVVEIGVVFLIFNVIKPSHYLLQRCSILTWELGHLGWSYIGGALLIVIPILLIVLKGEHLIDYGIHPAHLDLSLDLGLNGYLVCLILWLFGFGLLTMIGSGYNQPAGTFVLSLCYSAAGWLLFRWTRLIDRETRYPAEFHKRQLITYALLIAFPIILALIMHRFNTIVVSTLVWQIVFSGFGEEIYWRGYFQSRLTQAFGRPWQWQGIRFGAGLLVTSLLFGISHGLNATNLLTGETGFYLWWAIWTCFSGVFFGLLREKSGGVLAPALVHGVIDGVGETLAVIFGWF